MAIQYRDDAESSVGDRQYDPATEYGRRIRSWVCSHVKICSAMAQIIQCAETDDGRDAGDYT